MPVSALHGAWTNAYPAILAELQSTAPKAGGEPGSIGLPGVALATGAVALVLLAIMIVHSVLAARRRRGINDPRRLVRQLCEAHGFRRRQERLLLRAARVIAVQQPARFFLEAQLLAQAAEHPALASRRDDLLHVAAELYGAAVQS